MGNWFGSSEPPPVQSYRESRTVTFGTWNDASYPSSRISDSSGRSLRVSQPRDYNALTEQMRHMRIREGHVYRYESNNTAGNWTSHTEQTRVQNNPLREAKLLKPASNISFITRYISNYTHTLNWDGDWATQPSIKFFKLDRYSNEYYQVKELFDHSNKRCFQVTQIERIQNPYLLAAFLLKKEEMEKRIGYQEIEQLFHGTKNEHVNGICTNNLDWRLYGQNVGNKFGQGISFTPISNYATHYGDDTETNRVMLLVHVLVGEECVGSKEMKLPPHGYDTTIKPDRHVIVKYEDNEFYPAYKITYCCTNAEELRRRNNNNRGNRKVRGGQHRISRVLYDCD